MTETEKIEKNDLQEEIKSIVDEAVKPFKDEKIAEFKTLLSELILKAHSFREGKSYAVIDHIGEPVATVTDIFDYIERCRMMRSDLTLEAIVTSVEQARQAIDCITDKTKEEQIDEREKAKDQESTVVDEARPVQD